MENAVFWLVGRQRLILVSCVADNGHKKHACCLHKCLDALTGLTPYLDFLPELGHRFDLDSQWLTCGLTSAQRTNLR